MGLVWIWLLPQCCYCAEMQAARCPHTHQCACMYQTDGSLRPIGFSNHQKNHISNFTKLEEVDEMVRAGRHTFQVLCLYDLYLLRHKCTLDFQGFLDDLPSSSLSSLLVLHVDLNSKSVFSSSSSSPSYKLVPSDTFDTKNKLCLNLVIVSL